MVTPLPQPTNESRSGVLDDAGRTGSYRGYDFRGLAEIAEKLEKVMIR